jgi:cytochrome c-type biogenesis protein CcmH/NrfG
MARKTRHVPRDPDLVPRRKRSTIVGVGVGILAAGLVLSSLGPLAVLFESPAPAPASSEAHQHLEASEATKVLEAAVQANPKDSMSLIALGNAYYDEGKFPKAAEIYARALEVEPNNPDVRTDMGTALFYQGKSKEAIDAYHRAIHDQPDHLNAHMNLGIVYRSTGNAADAKAHWTKAMSLVQDPDVQKQLKVLLESVGG